MRWSWHPVIAAILALAAFVLPAQAEPYRLRIGWVVAGADLATLMFARPELARHASGEAR